MITRHHTITVDKIRLESTNDPNYIKHIYRRVAQEFADELAEHIEPKEIIDTDDRSNPYSGMNKTVILHFELTGGSLPDHESDT